MESKGGSVSSSLAVVFAVVDEVLSALLDWAFSRGAGAGDVGPADCCLVAFRARSADPAPSAWQTDMGEEGCCTRRVGTGAGLRTAADRASSCVKGTWAWPVRTL